jgi:hypothetical protein
MWKKSFKIEDNLYPLAIIEKAIIDFSDYAIIYNNWSIIVSWENEEDFDELFHEFMNYVIALCGETL